MATPIGVRLIATVTGVAGGTVVFVGLLWVLADPTNPLGVISLIGGLALIALSIGLWAANRTAWLVLLGLYGVALTLAMFEIAAGSMPAVALAAVIGVVVWYLVRKRPVFDERIPAGRR